MYSNVVYYLCVCILYNFQLRIYYSLLLPIVRVILLIMTNVAPCECGGCMLVEPITWSDWCWFPDILGPSRGEWEDPKYQH